MFHCMCISSTGSREKLRALTSQVLFCSSSHKYPNIGKGLFQCSQFPLMIDNAAQDLGSNISYRVCALDNLLFLSLGFLDNYVRLTTGPPKVSCRLPSNNGRRGISATHSNYYHQQYSNNRVKFSLWGLGQRLISYLRESSPPSSLPQGQHLIASGMKESYSSRQSVPE